MEKDYKTFIVIKNIIIIALIYIIFRFIIEALTSPLPNVKFNNIFDISLVFAGITFAIFPVLLFQIKKLKSNTSIVKLLRVIIVIIFWLAYYYSIVSL